MAATITIADKREAEIPGTFQFIVDEMLKANNIPLVKFPETVISTYKTRGKAEETRKRPRSSDGGGGRVARQTEAVKSGRFILDTGPN